MKYSTIFLYDNIYIYSLFFFFYQYDISMILVFVDNMYQFEDRCGSVAPC